jgi:hypothetical protein
MVFLSNPPEANKSLRLPCGMRSLFLWGYAQKLILEISIICLWLFFLHALILNQNPHLWMDTVKKIIQADAVLKNTLPPELKYNPYIPHKAISGAFVMAGGVRNGFGLFGAKFFGSGNCGCGCTSAAGILVYHGFFDDLFRIQG